MRKKLKIIGLLLLLSAAANAMTPQVQRVIKTVDYWSPLPIRFILFRLWHPNEP